jgi:hypothetical protein
MTWPETAATSSAVRPAGVPVQEADDNREGQHRKADPGPHPRACHEQYPSQQAADGGGPTHQSLGARSDTRWLRHEPMIVLWAPSELPSRVWPLPATTIGGLWAPGWRVLVGLPLCGAYLGWKHL